MERAVNGMAVVLAGLAILSILLMVLTARDDGREVEAASHGRVPDSWACEYEFIDEERVTWECTANGR